MASTPLELEYSFLKEQGITYIQQLARKKWKDYGEHDPGITILEVLSFAIVDLEYRINSYVEDIWAKNPDAAESVHNKQFYRAEEILPCNPLTQWDFLKVVLDVPGVKDANIFLSDSPKEIKGGYKIYVNIDERIKNTTQENEVLDLVRKRLYAQRNLCEDFFLIQAMQALPISIKATFEVYNFLAYEEGETIVAQILFAFHEFLSPQISFYNISQLLEKGKTIDQIFTGPLLTQGFIDEEELIALKKRAIIYTADLLEKATMLSGIKNVLSFELFIHDENTIASTVTIPILPDRSFVLNIPESNITLSYNGVSIGIDWEKVLHFLENMKRMGSLNKTYLEEEVFVLEGNYMNLQDYFSIQQDFPLLYNVGYEGCPPSELPKNHAKAKQLKSYLMFFDQLFANYFSQLSDIKEEYSMNDSQPTGRLPLDVPRIDTIIKQPTQESNPGNDLEFVIQKKYLNFKNKVADTPTQSKEITDDTTGAYLSYVNRALESDIRSLDKRSRMLDHLLAYFAERFTTYSLHLYPKNEEEQLRSLNSSKVLFLKDYIQISRDRSRASNITQNRVNGWISYVPSGFKRRLYRTLGIKNLEKRFLHQLVKDHLYLDKRASHNGFNIFMGKNAQIEYLDFVMFKGKYENIQYLAIAYGINEEYYNIIKTDNGTYRILLYVDTVKNNAIELIPGKDSVSNIEAAEDLVQNSVKLFSSLNEQCEGFHLVEHILLRNSNTLETEKDPYSFTITLIFPTWPARFQQPSFRYFVEEMVMRESPAHIYINILWLGLEDMEIFENAYERWIHLKVDSKAVKIEVDAAAKVLMNLIENYNNPSNLSVI